jgi:dimethylamine monooxygenase subunit C
MINGPYYVPDKRKYIFLGDQVGITQLISIIEQVKTNNQPFEVVYLIDQVQQALADELIQKLSQQKMGCYLYVVVPWVNLHAIKQITEELGYSDKEAQYIGHGQKYIKVFCCRCHGIVEETCEKVETVCNHCELKLEISDHYSSLRDAYLGYVGKL